MKLRDIMNTRIDIDIYNDYCDDEGIALCNPTKLTPDGEKEFAEILDIEIETNELDIMAGDIDNCGLGYEGVAKIDHLPNCKHIRKVLNRFLWSAAGYCSEDDYDRWFEEV